MPTFSVFKNFREKLGQRCALGDCSGAAAAHAKRKTWLFEVASRLNLNKIMAKNQKLQRQVAREIERAKKILKALPNSSFLCRALRILPKKLLIFRWFCQNEVKIIFIFPAPAGHLRQTLESWCLSFLTIHRFWRLRRVRALVRVGLGFGPL